MTGFTRGGRTILAATLLLAVGIGGAAAQTYPTKPIRFIVGAGPDALARLIGQEWTKAWGQQVQVERIAAGTGIVAAQTVRSAAPDGQTLLNTTGAYLLNQAGREPPPFMLGKEFTAIALMGIAPTILIAPGNAPYSNVKDMIAYANSHPKTVNCASAGIGGTSHVACEMLRHYGKADVQHVPYQGSPAAQIDVLAGRAQLQFTAGAAIPLIKEGKLKALAVTGETRLEALPDVPTMKEQGYPDLTVITWYGIHGPAGIPAAVVEKINAETNKALKNPEVAKAIVNNGFDPTPMTVKEFQAFMADQEKTITKIWKETGAKME